MNVLNVTQDTTYKTVIVQTIALQENGEILIKKHAQIVSLDVPIAPNQQLVLNAQINICLQILILANQLVVKATILMQHLGCVNLAIPTVLPVLVLMFALVVNKDLTFFQINAQQFVQMVTLSSIKFVHNVEPIVLSVPTQVPVYSVLTLGS